MSSANPPYPYYNGIPFNPSFFTSDTGSGLTETAANALYLRKTTPDAATALETFNGGITVEGPTTLSAPITSAYTVVPTSGQIGFIPTTVFYNAITEPNLKPNNSTLSAFSTASLARIELTAGTWIVVASLLANPNANSGYMICAITPTINSWNQNTDQTVQSLNHPTIGFIYTVSTIVQITATTSYYNTTRTNISGQVVNTYRLIATRIA
jgi:hypothetical protein